MVEWMVVPLKAQLRTILGCYHAGAKKPALNIALSPTGSKVPYVLHLKARLSADEHAYIDQCTLLCEQGLSAARQGDLVEADQYFEKVHALLLAKELSREGYLHAKVHYEKGVGYLDYRRGHFEQAESRMYEALALDEVLEKEYGCAILHGDRIQLAYHVLRVYMRRQKIKKGLDLGIHLLNYLEGKSHTLPLPTSWDSSCFTALPAGLINHFFASVTVEIAYVLAGQQTVCEDSETLGIQSFLADIEPHTQPGLVHCCMLSPQAHAWLQAKEALGEERISDFFSIIAQALSAGPQSYPLLWYAMLVDLLTVCDTLDSREASLFRQRIARDTTYWQSVVRIPQVWQSILYASHKEEVII